MYLLDEFFRFLKPMSLYLLKSLTLVRYLVSLLHSLPSLRFSHALQAGMRYFYIPSEMSCAHKICFDTNTAVSLCCFFHTVTPLHSHNMDTLLLPWPFLSPSSFLFILPSLLPLFNSIMTLPFRGRWRGDSRDGEGELLAMLRISISFPSVQMENAYIYR